MKLKRTEQFKTIVLVIGCVIISPALITYSLLALYFADRRRRRVADNFHCTQCGSILGRRSIVKADKYWRDYVRKLRQEHPGARLRLARNVWAICMRCDAQYYYRKKDNTYILQQGEHAVVLGMFRIR